MSFSGTTTVTSNKTLGSGDAEIMQLCTNSSDIVITVPASGIANFADIPVRKVSGGGTVTLAPDTGVTIAPGPSGSLVLSAPNTTYTLRHTGSTTWVVEEDALQVRTLRSFHPSDDDAAFAAAADWLRDGVVNLPQSIIDVVPRKLVLDPGIIYLTEPVNLQSIRGMGWEIDGAGCIIVAQTTDKACLDLLGSRWGVFRNLTVIGDPEHAPAIGIQVGRLYNDVVAGQHVWENIRTAGTFGRCCFYNLASEVGYYQSCHFYNESTSTSTYTFIVDGYNHLGNITDYDFLKDSNNDEELDPDTPLSCIQHTFDSCIFASVGDFSGGDTGAALWFINANQVVMENCYQVSLSNIGMKISQGVSSLERYSLELHTEMGWHTVHDNAGVQTNIVFDRIGDEGAFVLDGFNYVENANHAVVSVFAGTETCTLVRIQDANISITDSPSTPTDGIFAGDDIFYVAGRINPRDLEMGAGLNTFDGIIDLTFAGVMDSSLPKGSFTGWDTSAILYYKGRHTFVGNRTDAIAAETLDDYPSVFLEDGNINLLPNSDGSDFGLVAFKKEDGTTAVQLYSNPANKHLTLWVNSHLFFFREDGTFALNSLTSAPGSPVNGTIWYDSSAGRLRMWQGVERNLVTSGLTFGGSDADLTLTGSSGPTVRLTGSRTAARKVILPTGTITGELILVINATSGGFAATVTQPDGTTTVKSITAAGCGWFLYTGATWVYTGQPVA